MPSVIKKIVNNRKKRKENVMNKWINQKNSKKKKINKL